MNAHGTSTPYNDKSETTALKNVFGDYAKNGLVGQFHQIHDWTFIGCCRCHRSLLLFFTHQAVCKAIETKAVPPTINYEEPDPGLWIAEIEKYIRPAP